MSWVFNKQNQSWGTVFWKWSEQLFQPSTNSNQNSNQNVSTQNIWVKYVWFWDRARANIIDAMLSYLIIPLLFNLVFYFKDWDTIWYKIIWAKIRKDDWVFWSVPWWWALIWRHLVRYISFMAILWVIRVWFEKNKRSWHDMAASTVVIKSWNGYPWWSMFFAIIFTFLVVIWIAMMWSY